MAAEASTRAWRTTNSHGAERQPPIARSNPRDADACHLLLASGLKQHLPAAPPPASCPSPEGIDMDATCSWPHLDGAATPCRVCPSTSGKLGFVCSCYFSIT
jgi:hypothetical protein